MNSGVILSSLAVDSFATLGMTKMRLIFQDNLLGRVDKVKLERTVILNGAQRSERIHIS